MAMAVTEPYDLIRAERLEQPGVVIKGITGDGERLPRDPQKNTAGGAATCGLELLRIPNAGVALTIHKGLPLESGIGSSATSAVWPADHVTAPVAGCCGRGGV